MELLQPILTEVLSTPTPTQLSQDIWCFCMTPCILANIPSAVDEEDMHMSKNCVHTIPRLISNMRTVRAESPDPSVAMANGPFFILSTRILWKCGATAPFIIHVVFVLLDEKFFAIWLSENTSWKSGVSLSATGSGILCFTSIVAILTSARVVCEQKNSLISTCMTSSEILHRKAFKWLRLVSHKALQTNLN